MISRWHYERIPGRDNGREWRVANDADDVVGDYETEEGASECCRAHNVMAEKEARRRGWDFGMASSADYEAVLEEQRMLLGVLDTILNGAGAASRPAVIDIIGQLKPIREQLGRPILEAVKDLL